MNPRTYEASGRVIVGRISVFSWESRSISTVRV
jgi:hypothetical protein